MQARAALDEAMEGAVDAEGEQRAGLAAAREKQVCLHPEP